MSLKYDGIVIILVISIQQTGRIHELGKKRSAHATCNQFDQNVNAFD